MSRQPSPPTASADESLPTLLKQCRVADGESFRIADHAGHRPDSVTLDRAAMEASLARGIERLAFMQERLYASATWSLLVVIQAMDAAGKDSAIKHVFSGINPQGVAVTSFKAPGPEELAHDFLWRVHRVMPSRGMIGVFNRSYFEEVLVTRVHRDILAKQKLPAQCVDGDHFWRDRIDDIRSFEAYMGRQGTKIVKIFLNVTREEQKKRFLARLDTPDKLWKFDAGDLAEREHWDEYMAAYEKAIRGTATDTAPWFIVPADSKRLARLLVLGAVVDAIEEMELKSPEPAPAVAAALDAARRRLLAEKD